jgi:hypothetical protein
MMIPRKRTVCNDGISLSIQVGKYNYCHPREDFAEYTSVEVGYIQNPDGTQYIPPREEWEPYADGSFPSSVYGYVPVELLEKFIAEHGGRKNFV